MAKSAKSEQKSCNNGKSIVISSRVLWVGTAESEVNTILRLKLISVITVVCIAFSLGSTGVAGTGNESIEALAVTTSRTKYDKNYEILWQNSTDEERYYFPAAIKAQACGISEQEFILFAKVVEGEGAFCEDDITDKVLVACTVLNRINCKRWPTSTVTSTVLRNGQFLAVNQETHECNISRTLDSEWAVVEAYRAVAAQEIDCHMVYYNSIGFTGYSRQFTNYIDCSYCHGNYFSVIDCSCENCTAWNPDWCEEDVEMIQPVYERPIGSITSGELIHPGRTGYGNPNL